MVYNLPSAMSDDELSIELGFPINRAMRQLLDLPIMRLAKAIETESCRRNAAQEVIEHRRPAGKLQSRGRCQVGRRGVDDNLRPFKASYGFRNPGDLAPNLEGHGASGA